MTRNHDASMHLLVPQTSIVQQLGFVADLGLPGVWIVVDIVSAFVELPGVLIELIAGQRPGVALVNEELPGFLHLVLVLVLYLTISEITHAVSNLEHTVNEIQPVQREVVLNPQKHAVSHGRFVRHGANDVSVSRAISTLWYLGESLLTEFRPCHNPACSPSVGPLPRRIQPAPGTASF